MKRVFKIFISMLLIVSMCSVSVYADDVGPGLAGDSPDMQLGETVDTGEEIPPQQDDTIQSEEPIQPGDTIQPEEPAQPGDVDQSEELNPSEDYGDTNTSSDLDDDDIDDDALEDEDQSENDSEEDATEEEDSELEEDSEVAYEEEIVEYIGGVYTVRKPDGEESNLESEIELQAYSSEIEVYRSLEAAVKQALLAGKTSADVSGLKINKNKYSIYNLNSFSPYLSNGCKVTGSYSYNPDNNCYKEIQLANSMTASKTKTYFASVDAKVNEIMNQAAGLSSPEQIALAIHDYFVYEYAYDVSLYTVGLPNDSDSYTSGGLFMNEVGVCQAYAYGFMYIMDKMGIECHVTSSDAMNHAWNIINIGGSYYHVDCTWDDPVLSDYSGDYLGMVRHSNFLLSDTGIQNAEHYGWVKSYTCNNAKYDAAWWMDVESPIIINGNKAYYISGSSIVSSNLSGGSKSDLKSDLGYWQKWGGNGSYYTTAYSGLFLYNGELYYNTATELRKISLNGSGDALVKKPSISSGYIYGCREYGGKLQYATATEPGSKQSNTSISFPGSTSTSKTCQVTYDVNGGKALSPASVKLTQGKAYGELAKPTRKGYKFAGWYTAKSGGDKITATSIVPKTSKQTIYAQWKKVKYTITYDLKGGKDKSGNPTSYYVTSATITLKSPTKAGYTFKGWYTSDGKRVTEIAKGSTGNKSFTAKWSAKKYTITYNLNKGKNVSANPSSYTVSTSTITLKNPKRTGYTFKGWYSDSKYTKRVKQIAKGSTGNVTLYAKWSATNYTITYNLNKGKNVSSNPSSYKITTKTITLKNPKRTGYTFKGWYADNKYKTRVKTIEKGSTGNVTLYAKWKKK